MSRSASATLALGGDPAALRGMGSPVHQNITRVLATIGAATVLVVGFDAVTYAATGSSLILGKANTAGATTTISNTGAGAALALKTKSSASAPIVTNGKGLVKNLNAEKVGGQTAATLIAKSAPKSITYSDNTNRTSSTNYTAFKLPTATYLVTFNANVVLAGTASPAAPNMMVCWLYDGSKDLAEGAWTDFYGNGFWYASPTFSRVLKISSAQSIQLRCGSDSGQGWTVPSDGFGPTVTFTKVGAATSKTLAGNAAVAVRQR